MMRKVLVKWVDAVSHDNTVHIDEIKDLLPMPVRTLGYLIREENEFVIVARDLFGVEDDHPSGLITIPRGCLVDMKDLDSGEWTTFLNARTYINDPGCAPPGSIHIIQDEDGG